VIAVTTAAANGRGRSHSRPRHRPATADLIVATLLRMIRHWLELVWLQEVSLVADALGPGAGAHPVPGVIRDHGGGRRGGHGTA